ncbi:MAG: adenylate/guanylate cyclase domain-containing protein [Hyphomicrobiaceae bacterium]
MNSGFWQKWTNRQTLPEAAPIGQASRGARVARSVFRLIRRRLPRFWVVAKSFGDAFSWLLELGTTGYDRDTRRRLKIMNAIAYLIAFTTAIYAIQHASMDYDRLWPVVWMNAALVLIAILVPLSHRINDVAGGIIIVVAEWIGLFIISLYMGRTSGVHLQYFIGAAAPFVAFGLSRIRLILATVLSGLCLHLIVWFNFTQNDALLDVGADILDSIYTQAAITTAVMIAAVVWYAFSLAETARGETEGLLRNILPDSIVDRLKRRPDSVIADSYAETTVLFADISGFVALSRSLGPERTVDLLNQIVRRFDRLAGVHGVEKIKTIGDAYMAVAGVPSPCSDHAERAVDMALEMLEVIAEIRNRESLELYLRIGIASGQVMAGVIGTQKFSYDVWGDTVNLASRVEGASEPGRILISPATRAALPADYALEPRLTIDIKGVGPVQTWFIAMGTEHLRLPRGS